MRIHKLDVSLLYTKLPADQALVFLLAVTMNDFIFLRDERLEVEAEGRRCKAWIARVFRVIISFAASIKFLDGRQPRLTQVPPIVRSSVMTDVLPISCARRAAANAVEPEPSITRSNRCSCVIMITPEAAFRLFGEAWSRQEALRHNREGESRGFTPCHVVDERY